MKSANTKSEKRIRRHKKIRSSVSGSAEKPRLSVFKSNKHLYAQLIDDDSQKTLAVFSSLNLKDSKKKISEQAIEIGKELAKIAKAKGVTKVVFDRGGFVYQGKIKALADGAREGGLIF
ncbi:MAG: 50S ribosomal protein L18 [Candidatus Pacebacteria bacterium]|nr:50S ribosomal protein L18 [Candidatus Paceibacterota bacterium]MDD5357471.1 50S ribosomal protein L18 [Candidatus Paceibacterota bacterium]